MSGLRYPSAARLSSAADFERVFQSPTRSADAYFTVLARLRPDGGARLGLAIAKKQVRSAVDRNRLKRIARESFRLCRRQLPDVDLVVMARRAAQEQDNKQLAASLERHFLRIADKLRQG